MLDEAVAHARERPGLDALTPRELEVLQMIAFGMTNAEAARRLHLSVHAIKFHLAAIYRRLGVNNRTEAAVTYLRSMNGDRSSRARRATEMDFRLYARVLWRFRLLVACRVPARHVLALLSVVRVSSDGLTLPQTELWSSTARLGVTQSGFPWGRLFARSRRTPTTQAQDLGDPGRQPGALQRPRGALRGARDERSSVAV